MNMEVAAKIERLRVKPDLKNKSLPRVKIEILGGALVVAISLLTMLWRLSSLTLGHISSRELATKQQLYLNSPWWKSFPHIYGPYYLLLHATFAISRSAWSLRLASVIIGVITVALVYFLASEWHGYKIGLMTALIALLNFGQLAVSRDATAIVTQPLMAISLLFAIIILNRLNNIKGMLLLIVCVFLSLYVPGGLWLGIAAIVLSWPDLKDVALKLSVKAKLLSLGLILVLGAPITYRLVAHYSTSQLNSWLGYGLNGKPFSALHSFGLNLIYTPLDLFVRSFNLPLDYSLGHLPLIPITFSVLIVIGLINYVRRFKNWRWRSVLILMLVAWIMSGFGIISPLTLTPLLSVCAGTGIAYLIKQWYLVFPRNPIARTTGLIIITAVLIFSGIYSLRSYIVAWGNDPVTTSNYSHNLR